MIIAYLGQSVKSYLENFLRFLENLELRCPFCNESTVVHGNYQRHIHIADRVFYLPIQRVKCNGCNKTHAVLPDFISPGKHYSASDIELTLRDVEADVAPEKVEAEASIQTIRRWMTEYKDKLKQAAGALRSLLYKLFGITINEMELIVARGFVLLEKLLSALPKVDSSQLAIGESNLWLLTQWMGIYL